MTKKMRMITHEMNVNFSQLLNSSREMMISFLFKLILILIASLINLSPKLKKNYIIMNIAFTSSIIIVAT